MILSICIATRNRLPYLLEALDSILPQLVHGVEVVIVDGASTDGTFEHFSTLSYDDSVRYVRLEKNGGIDRDFDLAVQYASGQYCWLCADDDVFLPNAISRVLHELRTNPTVLIVDAEVRNLTLEHTFVYSRLPLANRLTIEGTDRKTLLITCGDHMSFIGSTILQRSIWQSRVRDHYYGTYFIHVGVVFQADIHGIVVVLPGAVIAIRSGNESWSSRTFDIWNVLWPEIIWSIPNVVEEAKRLVVARYPWKSAIQLLKFRALGAYTRIEFTKYMCGINVKPSYRIVAWIIAIFPAVVLNALASVALRIFMPNDLKARQDVLISGVSMRRKETKCVFSSMSSI